MSKECAHAGRIKKTIPGNENSRGWFTARLASRSAQDGLGAVPKAGILLLKILNIALKDASRFTCAI